MNGPEVPPAAEMSRIEAMTTPNKAMRYRRSDNALAGLKRKPRVIGGRCGACAYFEICNGNTRVRAHRITGDPWAEDPGCYLTDAEIGLPLPVERVKAGSYRGSRHEAPLSL